MKEFLPLGSIVVLKKGTKKIMIFGRIQIQVDTGKLWDYVGCLYPEGNINEKYTYLFNHEDIGRIEFKGYIDEEEIQFQERLRNGKDFHV